MKLRPASELTPPPVEWLWPGHLALENLVILDGDPDLGKSLVTLDLCARLTTGRSFPDGAAAAAPAAVLLLCVEDADKVVVPRLKALGADLTRVFPWPRDLDPGLPSFPAEIHRLDEALADTGAKLVIIDPIVAFLDDSVNLADDRSVRRALRALQRLAEKHHCVIVLVRHLNKNAGNPTLYRGAYSIAFVAACRLAWLAGRDPRSDDRIILAQQKNNYAPKAESLAYTLPKDSPRVEWLGPSPYLARDLAGRPRARPRRDQARDLLRTLLGDGPRTSAEVWQAVQEKGLSPMTVRRAKEELEMRCEGVNDNGKHVIYWLLPRQELPERFRDPALDRLHAYLRQMEEQFPRRTPIDDPPEGPSHAAPPQLQSYLRRLEQTGGLDADADDKAA